MKKNLFLTFFMIYGLFLSAQKNFIFENNWKEFHSSVTINSWYGGREWEFARDTLASNKLILKVPDTLKKGLIKLNFKGGDSPLSGCEVIYEGSSANVRIVKGKDEQPELRSDPETEYYWMMNDSINRMRDRVSDFRKLIFNFGDDKNLLTVIDSRYEKYLNDFSQTFERIDHSGFPVASVLLKTKNYPVPDWRITPEEQISYIRLNFFRYFNVNDPIFRRSPFFGDKISDYLDLSSRMSVDKPDSAVIRGIDAFFVKSGPSDTVTREIVAVMRPWLLQNNYDFPAEYLDENYLATQCSAENDMRLQERLQAYKRTAKGQTAPELQWTDDNGVKHSLAEIPGSMLLIFWASWCNHCMETLPAINEYTQKKGIKVLAISLDHDVQSWLAARSRYSGWQHIMIADSWNDQRIKNYGVYGTPTIFILDENKIIRGKVATLENLRKTVE